MMKKDHFTFINQIFGDILVRNDIATIWPRARYRFEIGASLVVTTM